MPCTSTIGDVLSLDDASLPREGIRVSAELVARRYQTGAAASLASTARRRSSVQAALRLVGVRPAALATGRSGERAVRAADRGVAAVVQPVVGHVVTCDVVPHVAL